MLGASATGLPSSCYGFDPPQTKTGRGFRRAPTSELAEQPGAEPTFHDRCLFAEWEFGGGRGGIRTLEALITPTRFPVARTRPYYATLPVDGAERVGFEPTEAINLTAFRERHLQPLGHLSTYSVVSGQPCAVNATVQGLLIGPAPGLVRPEGLEPPTFWSATKRSIH